MGPGVALRAPQDMIYIGARVQSSNLIKGQARVSRKHQLVKLCYRDCSNENGFPLLIIANEGQFSSFLI